MSEGYFDTLVWIFAVVFSRLSSSSCILLLSAVFLVPPKMFPFELSLTASELSNFMFVRWIATSIDCFPFNSETGVKLTVNFECLSHQWRRILFGQRSICYYSTRVFSSFTSIGKDNEIKGKNERNRRRRKKRCRFPLFLSSLSLFFVMTWIYFSHFVYSFCLCLPLAMSFHRMSICLAKKQSEKHKRKKKNWEKV